MIAFIKYDLFPFVVWGKVIKTDGNKVFLDKYNGWFHRAEAILPDDVAQKKIKEIEQLCAARAETLKMYNDIYRAKLFEIMPWKEQK